MDFNVILNDIENASNEEREYVILRVCYEMLKILYKQEYSPEDKRIIQEYVASGIYEKSFTEGIKYTNVRKSMIEIYGYYGFVLRKKFPEFNNVDVRKKMYLKMVDTFERILLDKKEIEKIDINTHEQMLEDIFRVMECGLGNTLRYVTLFRERMSVEEFEKSSIFSEIAFSLHVASIESDEQIKKTKLRNFFNFAQTYIIDSSVENHDIDLKNNDFLKWFQSEQLYQLEGYIALLDENTSSNSIKSLNYINAYISDLLKKAFETPDYELASEEKFVLEKYFSTSSNFFRNSIRGYSKLDKNYVNQIFEYLYKIERYSLEGKKDTIFLISLYEKNLVDDYEVLKKIAIKNGSDSQVLLLWKVFFDTTIIKKYLKSKKSNGEDPYKSEVMKAYIEEFIDHVAKKDIDDLDDLYYFDFDLIKDYFNNITKRRDFNIFGNHYISDFLQLMYTHRLPDEITKDFKKILKRNCKVSRIDAEFEKKYLSDFIDNPQNSVVTDENKMDDFIRHLGNLKLANYRILNQGLIDFVLKQSFISNSAISNNPEKYRGLIERCLEDLGRNDLPAKINQDDYLYFIRDFISKNLDIVGLHYTNSRILIKRSIVNDLLNHNSYEAIETVYHENTHSLQDYDINHSTYNNYYKYLMAKESILSKYNREFYDANYQFMFIEIDARITQVTKLVQFLKRIEPVDTMQLVLIDLRNTILSSVDSKIVDEVRNLQKGKLKRKTKGSNAFFRVEDLFDEIILQHPNYISQYPKLRAEYNEDGTLKRIGQILPSIDSEDGKKDGLFYLKILSNGNCFKPENLPEDINSIMSYEIQNKRSSYVIAILISQNIPRLLAQFDEIPKEKLPELHSEINNILKRVGEISKKPKEELTYSETAIFMGLTKENRELSRDALSMLYETQEKIEALGIVPILVSGQADLRVERKVTASKTKSPDGVDILAEAFYGTSENERTSLMSELIDLGYQIKPSSKNKDPDQQKKER